MLGGSCVVLVPFEWVVGCWSVFLMYCYKRVFRCSRVFRVFWVV